MNVWKLCMYGSSKYDHPCNIGIFAHNFVAYWCSSLYSTMAVWDTMFHYIVVHFNVVVTVLCAKVVFARLTLSCVQKSSRSSPADVSRDGSVAFLPVLHLSALSDGFSCTCHLAPRPVWALLNVSYAIKGPGLRNSWNGAMLKDAKLVEIFMCRC
jgi:hypothetical protein